MYSRSMAEFDQAALKNERIFTILFTGQEVNHASAFPRLRIEPRCRQRGEAAIVEYHCGFVRGDQIVRDLSNALESS